MWHHTYLWYAESGSQIWQVVYLQIVVILSESGNYNKRNICDSCIITFVLTLQLWYNQLYLQERFFCMASAVFICTIFFPSSNMFVYFRRAILFTHLASWLPSVSPCMLASRYPTHPGEFSRSHLNVFPLQYVYSIIPYTMY